MIAYNICFTTLLRSLEGIDKKDYNYFKIEPKLFDYLLFPHDLIHYVLPEERSQKRICYAFNLKNL